MVFRDPRYKEEYQDEINMKKHKEVFIMRENGMKLKEIAENMELSIGHVGTILTSPKIRTNRDPRARYFNEFTFEYAITELRK